MKTTWISIASGLLGLGLMVPSSIPADDEHDTAQSSWRIVEQDIDGKLVRQLRHGRVYSSGIDENGESVFEHLNFIVGILPRDRPTIMIGTAGLVAADMAANEGMEVTAIDIDAGLLKIAEKHYLRRPLHAGVKFVGMDGRGWLTREAGKEEAATKPSLFIDAFNHYTVASTMFTTEALRAAAKVADPVIANVIIDLSGSVYGDKLLSTWMTAFPQGHMIVTETGDPAWPRNVILCNRRCASAAVPIPRKDAIPYTDDRQNIELDGRDLDRLMRAVH